MICHWYFVWNEKTFVHVSQERSYNGEKKCEMSRLKTEGLWERRRRRKKRREKDGRGDGERSIIWDR